MLSVEKKHSRLQQHRKVSPQLTMHCKRAWLRAVIAAARLKSCAAAFETERIDARDRPTVILAAKNASKHCAISGLRSNFPALCKAIFAEHYGEQALHGKYAASILQVCTCTQTKLVTLTPATLDCFMQQSKEDIGTYRQSSNLPAFSTLSMVGFMSDCGMAKLKNGLIEEIH